MRFEYPLQKRPLKEERKPRTQRAFRAFFRSSASGASPLLPPVSKCVYMGLFATAAGGKIAISTTGEARAQEWLKSVDGPSSSCFEPAAAAAAAASAAAANTIPKAV